MNAAWNRSATRRFSSDRNIIYMRSFLIFDVEAIFPVPFCRGIHRPAGRRLRRHPDFSVTASKARLGMGQGLLKLGEVTQ